ncbi:hypothetical protein AX15_006027 [Amanita polypyramis BW_CC]|nr:hypothetical protein AX15_006027 [Amanita polypyramis BW_CC]
MLNGLSCTFLGVAVWVFFILANNVNGSIAETTTECNFTLDGAHAGYYSHQPDINNNNLQYNVTVFNQSGLSNSPHKLVISTSGLPYDAYMNFDYAIYTADLPDTIAPTSGSSRITSVVSPATTSSSHRNDLVGIVIGSVFGGLAFVVIVCIVFLLRRLYKSRNTDMRMAHPVLEDNDNEPPTGAHYEGLTNSISQAPWQNNSHSRSDNLGQWPTSHSSGSLPGNALLSGRSPSSPDYLSSPSSSTKLRGKYSPNARNVGNQDELRALRQMEINERIQNAQQQVNALTSRQSMSPPPNERGRSVETEQEMETMREQIRQLSHQIGNMQHERQSDWAMGLSDDAPPAYS